MRFISQRMREDLREVRSNLVDMRDAFRLNH